MSNAMHIFTCGNGSWTLIEALGDLLDFNVNKFVGNFKVFDIPRTYYCHCIKLYCGCC
jgi:hypothetical protein